MLILGIETSCDETAAAVVADGRRVMSSVVATQFEAHAAYGGVVPEIAARRTVDRSAWCRSYITTYLERDIRQLTHVGDLRSFETFLRLCAARTAQILDLTGLANEVGVSVTTAKRWIS